MGKSQSDLEKRMRGYEAISDNRLMRRTPVIIRVDGKSFKSFTKGLKKPFDTVFRTAMVHTMQSMCAELSGTEFAYTQSDEISFVLVDYKRLEQGAMFDYRVQKLVGVASSMASRFFNKHFMDMTESQQLNLSEKELEVYRKKYFSADFSAKVFSIPETEVANNLIWRQFDAVRNSVQSLARAYFSTKQLYGLNTEQMKEKLSSELGVDWDAFPTLYKVGAACKRGQDRHWLIDYDMPMIVDDRSYVEDLVMLER